MKTSIGYFIGGVLVICTLLFGCGDASEDNNASVEAPAELVHAGRTKPSKLVDAFTYNKFVNNLGSNSEFVISETQKININGKELIATGKHIKGWEDPGDFLQFELTDAEGDVFIDEINIDGWVKFGDNYPMPEDLLAKNKLKSDKFLWLEMNGKNYLFMVGWMYSGKPGILTVIDLDERIICVNKHFKITGIEDHNSDSSQDLIGKVSIVEEAVIDITGEDMISLE